MGIKPIYNGVARSGPTNIKEVEWTGSDGGLSPEACAVLHHVSVVLTGPFEHDGHLLPAVSGAALHSTPSAETPLSAVHMVMPGCSIGSHAA
jgi:hypothetical protein